MTTTETTPPDTFTRMDESTAEQWATIGAETMRNQPRVAEQFLTMLRQLGDITDGFATDQLTHCLQTATLAERAGADEEMVFASLCHDIGKVISVFNHPAIAAEMIRPYVRDEVYQAIQVPPGLPGPALLRPLRQEPRRARPVRGRALVRPGRPVRRRVGPGRLRPRLRHPAARALRAPGAPDDRGAQPDVSTVPRADRPGAAGAAP